MIETIRKLALKFGPTTAILLLSQATSALSLSLLPLLGLRVSDVYSIAVQTGTGPYNGLVLGVVYLLVIGRPSFARWAAVNLSVALFSAGLTIYSLVSISRHLNQSSLPLEYIRTIIILFGGGGLALGIASVSGVRQACLGRPWFLAGVTMLPNATMAAATLLIFLCFKKNEFASIAPALAWSAAAVFTAILFIRHPLPSLSVPFPKGRSESGKNKLFHVSGLVIGLITSTVFPIGFVTAAARLSPGSATILFLANRIGGAIVGIFVNAVLMVRINWEQPEQISNRFSAVFPAFSVGLVISSLALHADKVADIYCYVIVAAAWLCLTCSTPVVLREANVRRLGLVLFNKGIIDLALTSLVLLRFEAHPSVTGYFAASMISQQITCIVCGTALRNKLLVLSTVVGLVLSIVLLIWGW